MAGPAPFSPATPEPAPLRVLVVEDSLTIRKYLVRLLQAHAIDVVGEAADGQAAVDLCAALRPDVVTMDMILSGMSGLAATEQIMAFSPTPILIVSASTNRGEIFETYQALTAGAVDVFDKVRAHEPSSDWETRFVAAVRMTARIKVITHPRARLAPAAPADAAPLSFRPHAPSPSSPVDLVAIGASTGGPAAIVHILKALPGDFAIPILIVLHISELFAFAFAEWLNTLSPIPARYAVEGEPLPLPGRPQILLAPAGRHLLVDRARLRLNDGPERHSCKPSIDVFFESLAAQQGLRAQLCLLTGMGRDGAAGLLAARRAGLHTLAQDEASSVIFGMPGEAVRLGAAEQVLALHEIAPFLRTAASPAASPATQTGIATSLAAGASGARTRP